MATILASNTTEPPSTTYEPDWREPFIRYLTDGSGYTDRTKNERLMRRSKQYLLVDDKLWCKNTKEEILMKCITQEDGERLLKKSILAPMATMRPRERWLARHFEQGFIGRQL